MKTNFAIVAALSGLLLAGGIGAAYSAPAANAAATSTQDDIKLQPRLFQAAPHIGPSILAPKTLPAQEEPTNTGTPNGNPNAAPGSAPAGTAPSAVPADPTGGGVTPPAIPVELQELLKHMGLVPVDQQPTTKQLDDGFLKIWSDVGRTYHDPSKLQDWGKWKTKYQGKLNTQADLEAALKEMLASLDDKWTSYTPSSDRAKAVQNSQSGLHGLGLALARQKDGTYTVDYRTYGTEAYTSNLRRGDTVKSIGGKALAGLSKDEADALLLGKDGDKVDVVFSHDAIDETASLTFAQSPAAQMAVANLPNKIIAVHFPNYMSEEGIDEFHSLLIKAEMKSNNSLNGVVLDLRGNPGGRFDLALRFASIFMDNGVIVQSKTRDGRLAPVVQSTVQPPLPFQFEDKKVEAAVRALFTVPLIVITDENTASAAEIVTGAFKDNGRGIIVGTKTYGKGVGYSVAELRFSPGAPGGFLEITTLDYLTPNGTDLSNKGLSPNVVVVHPRGSQADEAMSAAVQMVNAASSTPTKKPNVTSLVGDPAGLQAIGEALAVSLILLGIFLWAVFTHQRQKRSEEQKKNKTTK